MRLISDDIWAVLTIKMEAGGEPMDGKIAVAEVIRNRIERKINCDGSLVSCVLRPFQFSCWNTDSLARIHTATTDSNDPVAQECMKAWHHAMLGASQLTQGATHYYNPKIVQKPMWVPGYIKTVTIGQHDFYRVP